jgi:putative hydrolase of the HAD superfamily
VRRRARVGVVSNNLIEETRDKLVFCRIAPLVDAVVVSGDEGVSKPDPRIFRIALERLGVAAHQAVMFGDSWAADIVGAARAGIRPVWFNPRRRPRPPAPPDVEEIVSLTPIEPLVTRLLDPRRTER